MSEKKDWCTSFPDIWYQWSFPWLKKKDISEICKAHDDVDDTRGGCDSTKFAKLLWKNRIFGAVPIFIVASLACWIKYPFSMMKRI